METRREKTEYSGATCVAIGYFDGVHRGHSAVISAAVECAKRSGLQSVALTFDMTKKRASGKGSLDLMQFSERERYIAELGIDSLCVLDFSEICDLDGKQFANEILVNRLHASAVFCGDGFRFSKDKGCGVKELSDLCRERGIAVTAVDEVVDGGLVSTTRIKALVKDGAVAEAARLLGHPLSYSGRVIEGRKLGRRLGFPTANQRFPEGVAPLRFGVYRSRAYADGEIFEAVSNIGVRPTVDDTGSVFIETYLIGYMGDLYNSDITVELHSFLRKEKRFKDEDELRSAVLKDIETVRKESAAKGTAAEKY